MNTTHMLTNDGLILTWAELERACWALADPDKRDRVEDLINALKHEYRMHPPQAAALSLVTAIAWLTSVHGGVFPLE